MTFEVIPSIDVLGGKVVRLVRGEFDAQTVYGDDPVTFAKEWERQGAPRLHVVDLDGARAGEPAQHEVVRALVEAVGVPVQVAGGIRTVDAGLVWLAAGADRVVMGTAALTDPDVLEDGVARIGSRLVVAPDVFEGEVRVSAWTQGTGEGVVDAARRLGAAGVQRLLITDIARDGMLAGPNVELLREAASVARVPVIASGGVASVADLRELAAVDGIEAAIVGKALYSGAITLDEALGAVA